MRHKNFLFAFLLSVAAFVSSGCGGTGTGGSSPFDGDWAGLQRFFDIFGAVQDQGFMEFFIDDNGFVSGTISKNSTNETVSLTGFVENNGEMEISWQFNGELRRTASGHVHISSGDLSPSSGDDALPTSNSNGPVGRLEFILERD